jgi:inner membrane protein
MASLITHAFVGAAIGQSGKPTWRKDWLFWGTIISGSILPDIDSIGFHMGVPYGSLWGHRGLTHSLLFALVAAICATLCLYARVQQPWKFMFIFFLAIASHGFLDAMTNGGLGVAFFSPFNLHRYFFPWRPVLVSPIGITRFFTMRGLRILGSEMLYIWCPTLILVALVQLFKIGRKYQPEALPLSNDQK